MLETIAIVLVAVWILGMLTSTTVGGLTHGLLLIAFVVIVIRTFQGRSV
jgi:hypothetical protein